MKTAAIVASGLIAGGLIATGSYWYASPYLAVNSIRESIESKDGQRFNQYVDYPQLRDDLKAYVVSSLTQAIAAESDGVDDDGMAALGTAIAIPIANSLIDSYLTSNVVAGLIDSTASSDVIAKKSQSNPMLFPDIQEEIVKSKLEFEKKMNQIADVEMRYTDMNNFHVSGRFDPGIKIGFEMSRHGLGKWKIAGLILPDYQQLQALAPQDDASVSAGQADPPTEERLDSAFEMEGFEENVVQLPPDGVNRAGGGRGINSMPPDRSTCWFQMQRRSDVFTGFECQVVSRVNANGDTVYDVVEPNGLKRSIVLWDDSTVEIFLNGQRYEGVWREDPERDIQIQLPQGDMAFRRPD